MTTTAGHSFYIGPIVFFYNQVNDTGSWEPLVYYINATEIWRNKKGGLWWEGFYYKKGTIQPAI
jgi:hypothetical protein